MYFNHIGVEVKFMFSNFWYVSPIPIGMVRYRLLEVCKVSCLFDDTSLHFEMPDNVKEIPTISFFFLGQRIQRIISASPNLYYTLQKVICGVPCHHCDNIFIVIVLGIV